MAEYINDSNFMRKLIKMCWLWLVFPCWANEPISYPWLRLDLGFASGVYTTGPYNYDRLISRQDINTRDPIKYALKSFHGELGLSPFALARTLGVFNNTALDPLQIIGGVTGGGEQIKFSSPDQCRGVLGTVDACDDVYHAFNTTQIWFTGFSYEFYLFEWSGARHSVSPGFSLGFLTASIPDLPLQNSLRAAGYAVEPIDTKVFHGKFVYALTVPFSGTIFGLRISLGIQYSSRYADFNHTGLAIVTNDLNGIFLISGLLYGWETRNVAVP